MSHLGTLLFRSGHQNNRLWFILPWCIYTDESDKTTFVTWPCPRKTWQADILATVLAVHRESRSFAIRRFPDTLPEESGGLIRFNKDVDIIEISAGSPFCPKIPFAFSRHIKQLAVNHSFLKYDLEISGDRATLYALRAFPSLEKIYVCYRSDTFGRLCIGLRQSILILQCQAILSPRSGGTALVLLAGSHQSWRLWRTKVTQWHCRLPDSPITEGDEGSKNAIRRCLWHQKSRA